MNTPLSCCGVTSRWVENVPEKGYYYCGECKKEVTLQEPPANQTPDPWCGETIYYDGLVIDSTESKIKDLFDLDYYPGDDGIYFSNLDGTEVCVAPRKEPHIDPKIVDQVIDLFFDEKE